MGSMTTLKRIASGTLATALVAGGLFAVNTATQAPEAEAAAFNPNSAVFTGKAPSGATVKVPMGAVGYPGATSDLPGWCIEWTQWNYSTVGGSTNGTIDNTNSAILNYIYQDKKASTANWPYIATASHELLDPTKNRTKKQAGDFGAPWGWYRTQKGDFANAVKKANDWIDAAKTRIGPYKTAPTLKLSSDKKTITLGSTWIKSKSGANVGSIGGVKIKYNATLTGNATFSNGKKTITKNAGETDTIKVTGTGDVTVKLSTDKVLPNTKVKSMKYPNGKSQDKVVVQPQVAAVAGSAKVNVPLPPAVLAIPTSDATFVNGAKTLDLTSALSAVPATVTDTMSVTYKDVAAATKGTFTSELWNVSTKKTTGVKSTTAYTIPKGSGTVKPSTKIEIPDARKYAGQTLVVYQTLKGSAGKTLASHLQINNTRQQVKFGAVPTVTTKAIDKFDADQYLQFGDDAKVTESGSVDDEAGKTVTATKTGIIGDTITGKDFPDNEKLTIKGWLTVDGGKDTGITGTGTATVGTNGTFTSTVNFNVPGPVSTQVTKKVAYDNPEPQKMVDPDTGEEVVQEYDDQGNPIQNNGIPDPNYQKTLYREDTETVITPSKYAGKTLTAYQEVYNSKGVLVAVHKDPNARSQSVDVLKPGIGTTATDKEDGDKTLSYKGGVVKDVIEYNGFEGGNKVTFEGVLMDQETCTSTGITGSVTITTPAGDGVKGTATVEFNVPSGYAGKRLTAYEVAKNEDGSVIASHEDCNSKSQTVEVEEGPEIGTVALDKADGDQYLSDQGGTVVDTIQIHNVKEGEEYTVKGVGLIGGTSETTDIFADKTFTAEDDNPTIELEFDVPASYAGKVLSFKESLFYKGELIASHNDDGTEKKQTIYVSSIGTLALDKADEDKYLLQSGGEVVDHIAYKNVKVGEPITVKGKLVIHTTAEDTNIEAEAVFTPTEANGTYALTFKVPEGFGGKDLVAYEYFYDAKGNLIAKHENPEDEDQTVYVPGIGTTLVDSQSGDHFIPETGGKVTDTIAYENVAPGKELTVKGKLVIYQDGEETGIEAEGKFTPEKSDGEFKLDFEIPEGYAGKSLTAYEYFYDAEGNLVAKHEDPNDQKQTVGVPEIGTEATDVLDGDHYIMQDGGKVKDTISYTNVTPGKEVTVKGEFVLWSSGEKTGITAEAKFTPETPDGTFELEFNIPAGFAGNDLVAYEYFYDADGRLIAKHENPEEPKQTIHVPEVGTVAVDAKDGDKELDPAGGTIDDTVEYKNLGAGTYTVEGVAMEKLADGTCKATDYTGSTKLVIDEKDGKILSSGKTNVAIKIANGNKGKTFVVFENIKDKNGKVIAYHTDCNDEKQTVGVGVPPAPPAPPTKTVPPVVDSGNAGIINPNNMPWIVGGGIVLLLLAGTMVYINRRNQASKKH